MAKIKTYKALLLCTNCGKRWKQEMKHGHRLYPIKSNTVIAKEIDNVKGTKINVEQNKIVCEHCGCSGGIINITSKYPMYD